MDLTNWRRSLAAGDRVEPSLSVDWIETRVYPLARYVALREGRSVGNARIRGQGDGRKRAHRFSVWLVCLILGSDAGKTVDTAASESVAGSLKRQNVGLVDDPVDHCGDDLISEDPSHPENGRLLVKISGACS